MALTASKGEVLLAVKRICSTRQGLKKFISLSENGSAQFSFNENTLIWNAEELAKLIENDEEFKETHSEFLISLHSVELKNIIDGRNRNFKIDQMHQN